MIVLCELFLSLSVKSAGTTYGQTSRTDCRRHHLYLYEDLYYTYPSSSFTDDPRVDSLALVSIAHKRFRFM